MAHTVRSIVHRGDVTFSIGSHTATRGRSPVYDGDVEWGVHCCGPARVAMTSWVGDEVRVECRLQCDAVATAGVSVRASGSAAVPIETENEFRRRDVTFEHGCDAFAFYGLEVTAPVSFS